MNDRTDIREGTCPQCGHNEVIEAMQSEFGESDRGEPMCVTYDARWVLPGQNPQHGHGPLYLYICRSCGFSQWYAKNPETIPISAGHRTRLIKGKRQETAIQEKQPETGIKPERF
jgi:predicted nucleic-acid-binding Zn-ribbon protein